MKKIFVILAVALTVVVLGMGSQAFAAAPVQAGTVASVKGEVKAVTPPDTTARVLKNGDPVFMGDKIETGADGMLQVQLLDKTVFTLGALGAITVDEFVYDPATDEGKVKASVAKGVFRVVSGKVAHKNPENMVLNFPAGSMGFRGTDVVGIVDGMKTKIILLGPVGTGRIYVTNLVNGQVITVDIDQAGYATIVDGPNVAPVAIFQVSAEELAALAQQLGLPAFNVEGYSPPDVPNPTAVDSNIQGEENTRDISPTNA